MNHPNRNRHKDVLLQRRDVPPPMNHPNRSRRTDAPIPHQLPVWMREREAGKQPKPEQIRTLRRWTTSTKPVMAAALHKSLRWYEEVESGRSAMHCNEWFVMRVAAHVMMSRMQLQARESAASTIIEFSPDSGC